MTNLPLERLTLLLRHRVHTTLCSAQVRLELQSSRPITR